MEKLKSHFPISCHAILPPPQALRNRDFALESRVFLIFKKMLHPIQGLVSFLILELAAGRGLAIAFKKRGWGHDQAWFFSLGAQTPIFS